MSKKHTEVIEHAPFWLSRVFNRAHELGVSNPTFTGNTANAIMFAGKYGPMIEPWYHHLSTEDERPLTAEIVNSNIEDGYPYITRKDGQFFLHYANCGDQELFKEGIIPDAYPSRLQEAFAFFSGIKSSQISCVRKEIAQTHAEFADEQNRRISVKFGHHIPDSEIIRNIRRWHMLALPKFSWVEQPRLSNVDKRHDNDCIWNADDIFFHSWLIREARKFLLTGACSDQNLEKILISQNTSQKGTHQGWETWQHAINSTLQLKTDRYDSTLRKGLRIGMLLHDIGKVNEMALWALGCHASYGAKTWYRLNLEGLSTRDSQIVTYVIRNHDVFGLADRAISEDKLSVKINFSRMADKIGNTPFEGWQDSIDIIADINDADIGSLPSLSFLKSLTPLLKKVFYDPKVIRGFANE